MCNQSVTGGPEQVLLWPGGSGGTRRKHRPGGPEIRRKHRFSEMGGGRPWPPPSPRRSQRLMIPRGPAGPPGQGTSWPLRRSSIHGDWPPVPEWLPGMFTAENAEMKNGKRQTKFKMGETPFPPLSEKKGRIDSHLQLRLALCALRFALCGYIPNSFSFSAVGIPSSFHPRYS